MTTPQPRRRHSEGARVSSKTASSTPAGRRKGTVRFDPYWKLSTFVPRFASWVEEKATFPTPELARASAEPGDTYRLIRVAPGLPGGREVVETFMA